MGNSTEVLTITIDTELKEQVEQIIQPMGISLEQLIIRFLVWCVRDSEQAIAYLKRPRKIKRKNSIKSDVSE